MSAEISGFVVVLASNVNEKDAARLQQAILSLKHVTSVEPVQAAIDVEYYARVQERHEIAQKIIPILYPPTKK